MDHPRYESISQLAFWGHLGHPGVQIGWCRRIPGIKGGTGGCKKSGIHQLRLLVYPVFYLQGFLHPRYRKSSNNTVVGPLLIFTTRGDGHIHLERGGCTYILIYLTRNTHVLDERPPKRRYGKANIQVEVSGNDGNPTNSTRSFQCWIWELIILRQQQQLPWTRLESWTSLEAKLTAGETVIAAISISLLLKVQRKDSPSSFKMTTHLRLRYQRDSMGLTDLLVKSFSISLKNIQIARHFQQFKFSILP